MNNTKKVGAFTLLELLVTIAVIATFCTLLLPAYRTVIQIKNRTVCGSNLRQIGMGILSYTSDNNGCFPPFIDANYHFWDYNVKSYMGISPDQPSPAFKCPADSRAYNQGSGNYARSYAFSGNNQFSNTEQGRLGLISYITTAGAASSAFPSPVRSVAQISHPAQCIMASEWWTSGGKLISGLQYQNQGACSVLTPGWFSQGQVPVLPGGGYSHGRVINFLFVDGHVEALDPADAMSGFSTAGNCMWTAVWQ
jgi:prepilin-type processing-associated H-X9-DG protein